MAISLLDIFNCPDYETLGVVLRHRYIESKEEGKRRETVRKRIALYEDKGKEYLEAEIDNAFNSFRLRKNLKKFADLALAHNFTKRIINETSVVYSDEAERKVAEGNERYQELLKALRFNSRMRMMNRYTNLANHSLVYFYVMELAEGRFKPALDVITQDAFYVISHPDYPQEVVGFIIDQSPAQGSAKDADPYYLVVSEAEFLNLNKAGNYIKGSAELNPYELIPAVLVSKSEPRCGLLDYTSGEDIPRGHLASALQQVYLLKDQKSGAKAAYASGEGADRAVRNQVLDKENLLTFPANTSVGTLDLGAEPAAVIEAQNAILQQTGAAYGLPLDLLNQNYQATSGYEIELKRIGLKEKRREQIVYCRDAERALAQVMARVVSEHIPELAYSAEGWAIDFGEYEVPLNPIEEHALFEARRNALLTSTPEQMRRRNPDIEISEARSRIKQNALDEQVRLDLQTRTNSSLDAAPGEAKTPEENGAMARDNDSANR